MRTFVVLAILLVAVPVFGGARKPEAADTVFINGNIYTGNTKQKKAEAVAVKNGKIVYVGTSKGAKALVGAQTRVVDFGGRAVFPGFTDAHAHLSGIGLREMTLNLEGCANLSEFLDRVKARVDKAPKGAWVTGRGWIETFWSPPVFPTREDLDRIAPDNPVFLVRADGHGAVVNSAALKVAGVGRETENPFGGEIMRDKSTGEPNGMLLDNAHDLVTKFIPAFTEADLEQSLVLGARHEVELGWCEIQNAGSPPGELDRIRRLYAADKIKLRIYNAISGPSDEASKLIADGPSVGEFNGRLTVRTIKVHFDGALGSQGAALLEPYSDRDSVGFVTYHEEDLLPMFTASLRSGIQIETHAIGDRANRLILDYYEKAMKQVATKDRKIAQPRWRVEHAQIVHPDDIPRFAKLGVIASMQPSHAIGDLHFAGRRIGLKRLVGAYAWKSFLDSGTIVAGGSDAPVEVGDPMIEFYAAVARKDLQGRSGEGWHPEQAVTRDQALKMLTLWPAVAAFEEQVKGTIEVGKYADFTVLSADIMTIPFEQIPKTRCTMTVIAGEVVHDISRSTETH